MCGRDWADPMLQPTQWAIDVADAGVAFARGDQEILAFTGVSLKALAGAFVVLIGPSGCGKSTLLRAIADLLPCTEGEVAVFGSEPARAREQRRISFVFQDATLLPWRSVIDNVRLPLQVGGWTGRQRPGRTPEELVELVGLKGREAALPHELSGGQRQRVSIARALVTNPDVLLMDEPFGALDEITRDRLNDELLRIWRETDTTIVFVTHSLTEAAFLGQSVVVMGAGPGRIIETIDLKPRKPDNRIDRNDPAFFAMTSDLRAVLERAYGSAA
ncbi:ABC transporter ATP-binding protein [Phreatobacter stygius]|uniref:ABC transporter ATP-binding protein n=2 Tax=Phreatobacter stygius TaxID=1940610 RepID=A0A4D7B1B7_9HYPH|nr:ABC transporter ATP-binding protein [Phreatobacter stygius]